MSGAHLGLFCPSTTHKTQKLALFQVALAAVRTNCAALEYVGAELKALPLENSHCETSLRQAGADLDIMMEAVASLVLQC